MADSDLKPVTTEHQKEEVKPWPDVLPEFVGTFTLR
jgi:hypothetical protein